MTARRRPFPAPGGRRFRFSLGFSAASAQAPPIAASRPSGFRGKRRSGGIFSSSLPHPLALRAQVQSEPMDVEGDDREADRQFEPVRAAQPDLVQPAMLQIVDRRLHPGMLPARRREGRFRLAAPARPPISRPFRQSIQFQEIVQRFWFAGLWKPRSKLHPRRFGNAFRQRLTSGTATSVSRLPT